MNETLFRAALLEMQGLDVATGRARVSFSSEHPVLRRDDPKFGTHLEVLSHAPGDMNYGVLDRQGVVLLNHEETRVIGRVVPGSVRPGSDKKGRAEIELDSEFRSYLQKIASGNAPNFFSVGYSRISVLGRQQGSNGIPIIRFAWMPTEISILTKDRSPADPFVGLGRSLSKTSMNNSLDQLLALALSGSRKTESDCTDYSLVECINTLGKPPQGLIREVHETVTHIGGQCISGRYVPFSALVPRLRRDSTVGNFASGGALVANDIQPITSILRNKCVPVPLHPQSFIVSADAANQ